MTRSLLHLIFFACYVTSCAPDSSHISVLDYNPYLLGPGQKVQLAADTLLWDSVVKSTSTIIKGELIDPGEPVSIPTTSNLHTIEAPKTVALKRTLIDKDSVAQQAFIPSSGKKVSISWPEWSEASPGMRKESPYQISYLDLQRGLESDYIFCLLEDQFGNIWIGTWGGGLSIWDGTGFRHIGEDEGLGSDVVLDILEDVNGHIWINTFGGGVTKWDGNEFTRFTKKEGLIDDSVWSLLEDDSGHIWIGTANGLSIWNGAGFKNYNYNGRIVYDLMEDREGHIWMATLTGLYKWQNNDLVHYAIERSSMEQAFSLIEDSTGKVWIVFEGVIGFLENNEKAEAIKVWSLPRQGYGAMLEDQSGRIVVSGNSNLSILDQHALTYRRFSASEGLSHNKVFSILQAHSQDVWIGTNGGGVNIIKENAFTHFAQSEELANSFIRSVSEDGEGKLWIPTENSSLYLWNGREYIQYPAFKTLDIWFRGIFEDKSGDVWITTWGKGLYVWNRGKPANEAFVHYTNSGGLLSNDLRTVFEDGKGRIWLGAYNGFITLIPGKRGSLSLVQKHFFTDNMDIYVDKIYEDKSGRIWMGTSQAVLVCTDSTITRYHFNSTGMEVRSFAEDELGNIWIGTHKGLYIWDGADFTKYTDRDGLPSSVIKDMVKDESGNIWVGTFKGVSRLNRTGDDQRISIENYGAEQGMANTSINAMNAGKNDVLWLATNKGFSQLDLKKLVRDTLKPSISIRGFQPIDDFVDWRVTQKALQAGNEPLSRKQQVSLSGISIDSVYRFTNLPVNPTFPSTINSFTFRWQARHRDQDKLQYTFVLEKKGKSVGRSSLVKDYTADFRDLAHGAYTFKVRAVAANGRWSETASYSFIVRPPWWQTWQAYVSYVLLALMAVWGFLRWRTYSLRVRVMERTREIREQIKRSDELLLNILPAEVARELKQTGKTKPVRFERVSILFADFKGFTNIVASIPGDKLVEELDDIFKQYDDIMEEVGLEKIQTVGDGYLAAGGLPTPDPDHAKKCVIAAQQIIAYLEERNKTKGIKWSVRIGIHSGPITAGVIGKKKFSYDLFGDTINIAARIESASEPGRINISAYTYTLIKDHFPCTYRGKINAKGKGELDMYFVG